VQLNRITVPLCRRGYRLPTILTGGTDEQREMFVGRTLRGVGKLSVSGDRIEHTFDQLA